MRECYTQLFAAQPKFPQRKNEKEKYGNFSLK
jgi:hypothetical protein